MNSVHLVTQEKYRVKQGQNRLSAPSAQPIGPAARPGRAARPEPVRPAPARPCRLRRACVLRAPPAPCLRAARPACAPCAQPIAQLSLKLNWAVAHPGSAHFFFLLFFHFFQPLENTKNIFIYFLSFSSTPINLLKFISSILFFFFPTTQINCLNLFYLFSCSSLHIVNSKVCFPTCLCAIYLSTQTFTSHIQHVI